MSFIREGQHDSICIPEVPTELLDEETIQYVIESVYCLGKVSHVEYIKRNKKSRYTALIHFDHWANTPSVVEFRAVVEHYGYIDLHLPLWVISGIIYRQNFVRVMIYTHPIHPLSQTVFDEEEEITELSRKFAGLYIDENADLETKPGKVYPIMTHPMEVRETDRSDSTKPLHEEVDYEDADYEDTDYEEPLSKPLSKSQRVNYHCEIDILEEECPVIKDHYEIDILEEECPVIKDHCVIDILEDNCHMDVEPPEEPRPPVNMFHGYNILSSFNDDFMKYIVCSQVV
jgi:hypothetical protein